MTRTIQIKEFIVFKRAVFIVLASLFSFTAVADTALWHCTATNSEGAVWNWFGLEKEVTTTKVQKECEPFNDHHSCSIVCFPPKVYWRCMAHDTPPTLTATEKANPVNSKIKQRTWYWVSYSKQIAINGARDACRHNSAFGGCYANPDDCGAS